MNTIRKALLPLILLPALTATTVQAGAMPAPAACTQAVDSLTRTPAQHRANLASRPRADAGQNQTYWINSRSGDTRTEVRFKSKCVTSAEGKVVSLRVEQGYWK